MIKMTIGGLYEAIEHFKRIDDSVTSVLLELDVMTSTTTQAALNDLIVELGNRVKDEADIVIDAIDSEKPATFEDYNTWIDDNFTEYSADMYRDTLKKQKK